MLEFLDYQVRDVMSRPVSVGPQTSLAEAERLLEKHGFNARRADPLDDVS